VYVAHGSWTQCAAWEFGQTPKAVPSALCVTPKNKPAKNFPDSKSMENSLFFEPPLKARFTGGPPRLFSRATRHFPSGRITPQPIGLPGAVLREVPELRLAIRKSELARFPLPLLDCRNFPCPWETPISRVLQASRTILWNLSPKKPLGIQVWASKQAFGHTNRDGQEHPRQFPLIALPIPQIKAHPVSRGNQPG